MTCIVALRYKNNIVVGSESLTTLETTKLVNVCNESKIIDFKYFTILTSGDGPLVDVLEFIKDSSEEWLGFGVSSRQDCINFITHFVDTFQERVPETGNEDLKYEFLLTNGSKIWWVINGPSVFEIGTFWCAGSGASYALGYLESTYHRIKSTNDAIDVVYGAISSACKYDVNCEGPIITKVIKNTLNN